MPEIDLTRLEEAKDITCALARKTIENDRYTLMDAELAHRNWAVETIADLVNQLVNGDG
jgi:hypothetical protein